MEPSHDAQFTFHELAADDGRLPPRPLKPNSGISHQTRKATLSESTATPAETLCCECECADLKTWNCIQCDDSFCDVCWAKQRPHRVRAPLRFDNMALAPWRALDLPLAVVKYTDTRVISLGRPVLMIDLTKRSTKKWFKDSNRLLAIPHPESNLLDT